MQNIFFKPKEFLIKTCKCKKFPVSQQCVWCTLGVRYDRTPNLWSPGKYLLFQIVQSFGRHFHTIFCWRSSHRRCSIEKAPLINFSIFSGKHLLESLIKLQALKRLHWRCFPVNIAKFFRTSILKNICKQLLLLLQPHFFTKRIFS